MASSVFIVQGEGRGHLSQSMALQEILAEEGFTVVKVFVGCREKQLLPDYFRTAFQKRLEYFRSPYFLRAPNKKGINLERTFIHNLLRSFQYLSEAKRIRKEIREINPDYIFNFYDVVGALATRKLKMGPKRIGVGHHFTLHLENYPYQEGSSLHRWLLKIHTRLILRGCDDVLALSFRELKSEKKIKIIPPLIRSSFRSISYSPGERFLVYLLNEGFLYDLIWIAHQDPGFKADVFTATTFPVELPKTIQLHNLDESKFLQKMKNCKGLICTAGFDSVAEAAYLGIPVLVIPSGGHFEQQCNSADIERSGVGVAVTQLIPGIQEKLSMGNNEEYKRWTARAGEMVVKYMEE